MMAVRRGPGPVKDKANGWLRLCEVVFYPLTWALGRRHVVGAEHLAIPGPVLVVANHVSHIDPLFDSVVIRKAGRWPHIMAKASLWKLPIVGAVMRGTQQLPVERSGSGGQDALEVATNALNAGQAVLIYPDGTVTKDPDMWPMRPRPGVAALALSGDFPVVPMARWGTQNVYRSYGGSGRFKPLPRKDIHILIGPPVDLSAYRGQPADLRAIRDVSYLIMGAVRDLLGEVRNSEPPEAFFDPKKADRAGKS